MQSISRNCESSPDSGLSVARVMALDSLWQQALTSTLAAPRKCGAPAFRAHARAKTVLTFARPF